jgi:hypothetical protein
MSLGINLEDRGPQAEMHLSAMNPVRKAGSTDLSEKGIQQLLQLHFAER